VADDRTAPPHLAAAIVCLQRSGSHMLASCLASHPSIGSFGEFVGRVRAVPFPTEPVVIGIIMYSQWHRALADGVIVDRVIHLLRDPTHTAISQLQNRAQRALNGAEHRAHAKQGQALPRLHPIDRREIEPLGAQNAAAQAEMRRTLGPRPLLEVRYEALTQGRSISELPAAEARRLLDFLTLPMARLHTRYVKTGPLEAASD
jgi:hypothetical protein